MTVELTYIKSENIGERRKSMVKKEEIINNKKTLKSETVVTDGKNYSSIKNTPNSIELRVEKIKS